MDSAANPWMLPDWVEGWIASQPARMAGREARMQAAIDLARLNAEKGTGGPFGAVVFAADSGELVAVGVNAVVPNGCSHAHAEMMALARAQQQIGGYDLGGPDLPTHELVTSCEPCAMCFGAIPWSGVRRLICGANDADARAIGFDEGPRPADWVRALEQRGIEVFTGVCREEARRVLRRYGESGGEIYNSRRG